MRGVLPFIPCDRVAQFLPLAPVLLDTGIKISCVAWNENGSILAIGGQQRFTAVGSADPAELDQHVGVVQFYNPLGDVRTYWFRTSGNAIG